MEGTVINTTVQGGTTVALTSNGGVVVNVTPTPEVTVNVTVGQASGGTGDVFGPASATANAIAVFNGTTGKVIKNSGASVDNSGNISGNNLSGTNTGDQTITLTGDVTGSGVGSFGTTIAANAVTNAKMADMAQSTIKLRAVGAGTGDPIDGTPTQATAILNEMVGDSGAGVTKGLVPAAATGNASTHFLRKDGTWTAPAGTAGDMTKAVYDPQNSGHISGAGGNGGILNMDFSATGGNAGGNINTSGGTSGGGGGINLSGGDTGFGGSIDLSSGPSSPSGGSYTAANGGGSVNLEGSGSIEFGIAASRTTLVGSGSVATVTLPSSTGTLLNSNGSGAGLSGILLPNATANGTYPVHNDGVTSGQLTSITILNGLVTAVAVIP